LDPEKKQQGDGENCTMRKWEKCALELKYGVRMWAGFNWLCIG
jgi:hypothetical protein